MVVLFVKEIKRKMYAFIEASFDANSRSKVIEFKANVIK